MSIDRDWGRSQHTCLGGAGEGAHDSVGVGDDLDDLVDVLLLDEGLVALRRGTDVGVRGGPPQVHRRGLE